MPGITKHYKTVPPPILSVIVPLYNETSRLFRLQEICNFFLHLPQTPAEIIIVNDGSTDGTAQALTSWSKRYPLKVINYSQNRGKGFAVRTGMLAASGRYRLFLDVDLSTSPSEWPKFKSFLTKNPVVIGIRRSPHALVLTHQSLLRENLGRAFTWLSRQVTGVPVNDFTCGFKAFSSSAAAAIFSRCRIDRWGFDAEILFLARRLGFPIAQVPVTWTNDPLTKVNLKKDIFLSLWELLALRLYALMGLY